MVPWCHRGAILGAPWADCFQFWPPWGYIGRSMGRLFSIFATVGLYWALHGPIVLDFWIGKNIEICILSLQRQPPCPGLLGSGGSHPPPSPSPSPSLQGPAARKCCCKPFPFFQDFFLFTEVLTASATHLAERQGLGLRR